MQQLSLKQKNIQRLSPQQIQLVKLLQIPAIDIASRIEEEMASNPALEAELTAELEDNIQLPTDIAPSFSYPDSHATYYRENNYRDRQAQERWNWRESNLPKKVSLQEELLEQLMLLKLDDKQHKIGEHLIGSLGDDGYIRRDITALVNDIWLTQYIKTNQEEVDNILKKIQSFAPPGIGARNLQECLLIQLTKQPPGDVRDLSIKIVIQAFEAFKKKHYALIIKKLNINNLQTFKNALNYILKLNPKPGEGLISTFIEKSYILHPDFIVTKPDSGLQVSLNSYNTPYLKIEKSYKKLLEVAQHTSKLGYIDPNLKEATTFAKQKVEAAIWFMEALKQRQQTLLKIMQAIVTLQHDFFIEGDEAKLKPMILKDVATAIGMDISTVSRVVSNKAVRTYFGTYPLKYFFNEAIQTTLGEEVSSQSVRKALQDLVEGEDKQSPYSDEMLTDLLQKQGFYIARRTIAKYREQLHIPVARLRKSL